MSFDVTVGTRDFNYTYNMGRFLEDFVVHPVKDMHGHHPQEVALMIADALTDFTNYPAGKLSDKYDDPTGWGSVEGATRFLFEIYMACVTENDVDTVEAT